MKKMYLALTLMGTTAIVSGSAAASTLVLPSSNSYFSQVKNYGVSDYLTNNFASETGHANSFSTKTDQEAFIKALTDTFNSALKIAYENNQIALTTFLLGGQSFAKSSKAYEEGMRVNSLKNTFTRIPIRESVTTSDSENISEAVHIPQPPKGELKALAPGVNTSPKPISLGSLLGDIQKGFKLNPVSRTTSSNSAQKPMPTTFKNELFAKIRARGVAEVTIENAPVKPVVEPVKAAPKVTVKDNGNTPPPPPVNTPPAVTVKNIRNGSVSNPLLDAIKKGTTLNKTAGVNPSSKKPSVSAGDLASALQERFKNGTKLNKTNEPAKKKEATLEELKAQLSSAEKSLEAEKNLFEKRRISVKISDLQELIASKEFIKKETASSSAKAALVKKSEESAESHSVTRNSLSPEAQERQRLLANSLKKTRTNGLKDRGVVRSMSMGVIDRSAAIKELEQKAQKAFQKGTRSLIENGYKALAEPGPDTMDSTGPKVDEALKTPVTSTKATAKKIVEIKLDENGVPIPPPPPAAGNPTKTKANIPAVKPDPGKARANLMDAIVAGKALKKISNASSEEKNQQENTQVNFGDVKITLSKTFVDLLKNGVGTEDDEEDSDWEDGDESYTYGSYSTNKTTMGEKEFSKPTLKKLASSPAIIMTAPLEKKVDQSKISAKNEAADLHKKEAEERSKEVSLRMKKNAGLLNTSGISLLDQIQGFKTNVLSKVDHQAIKEEKKLEEERDPQNFLFSAITSRRSSMIEDDSDDEEW